MNKILIIIRREYLAKVTSRPFILVTILVPLLLTAAIFGKVWMEKSEKDVKRVYVVDESSVFRPGNFPLISKEYVKFDYSYAHLSMSEAQDSIESKPEWVWMYIPKNVYQGKVLVYGDTHPGRHVMATIRAEMKDQFENTILLNKTKGQISKEKIMASLGPKGIPVEFAGGNEGNGIYTFISAISAVLMYGFILIYGVSVMRGVMEEKSSRIVEIILSSVKPFQLLLGKIFSYILIGLSQITVWIIIFSSVLTVMGDKLRESVIKHNIEGTIAPSFSIGGIQQLQPGGDQAPEVSLEEVSETLSELSDVSWGTYLFIFLFFFLFGHLFYSSLFAAVGSAVNSETDPQQFALPITLPIVFSLLAGFFLMENSPNGGLATTLTFIPLSAPIMMVFRAPFILGTPMEWQLYVSGLVLVLSFFGSVWISGRIYKNGILSYGRKISYKDLFKWAKG